MIINDFLLLLPDYRLPYNEDRHMDYQFTRGALIQTEVGHKYQGLMA